MEEQMTKARLLEQMRQGRADLEALVDGIGETQMEQPAVPGDWSVKDVLAHVSAWERHLLGWLEAEAKGEKPDLPVPPATEEAIDQFNAQTYATHRDQPPAAVRAEFRASFQALLAKAEALSEAELLDPNRFAFAAGRPAWSYFAVISYWHYPEHFDQIQAAARAAGRQ